MLPVQAGVAAPPLDVRKVYDCLRPSESSTFYLGLCPESGAESPNFSGQPTGRPQAFRTSSGVAERLSHHAP